jgi:broad specificity phosphatase PhoE
MAKIVDEIKSNHLNEAVLVVSHGGALRAAMVSLLNMPIEGNWSFVFGNCGLTTVDTYEDNAVLRHFNDTSHLNGTVHHGLGS